MVVAVIVISIVIAVAVATAGSNFIVYLYHLNEINYSILQFNLDGFSMKPVFVLSFKIE